MGLERAVKAASFTSRERDKGRRILVKGRGGNKKAA